MFPVGFLQRTKDSNALTLVPCDPNRLVEPIHPKAMIKILEPEDVDTWSRGSYDEVIALQRPFSAYKMTITGASSLCQL